MNSDDIIKTAMQAGISVATSDNWMPIIGPTPIERFFKLAYEAGAKDEREACAIAGGAAADAGRDVAAAIRARGDK